MARKFVIGIRGILSVFVPSEGSLFLWLEQSFVEFILSLEVVDLLFLKLDSNFLHRFFGFTQLFLFYFVKGFQFIFKIIKITVFYDVDLLETG